MDTIDKWLKSLRLHKYTHLFKSLTYEQMLNLEENYLIDLDITKGARNKMLVSIKKLNLRQERLINMIDDLDQDNISMKEALTVLKDMLITPIPAPIENSIRSNRNNYLDPYELTYLFIETFEKVARRLIELAGMEDNACHGIMAAIVDECLKHNSFTKEQKAKVASFKQHFSREQKAKMASLKHHQQQQQQQQHQQSRHNQRAHNGYINHHHYPQHQLHINNNSNHHHLNNHYNLPLNHHHHLHSNHTTSNHNDSTKHHYHYNQHHNHHHNDHWNGPIQQLQSLSTSLSTIGSASTSDEEERQTYKEYSLLGPGTTFELPCLRALADAEKHNRRQLGFFSVFRSKSSC